MVVFHTTKDPVIIALYHVAGQEGAVAGEEEISTDVLGRPHHPGWKHCYREVRKAVYIVTSCVSLYMFQLDISVSLRLQTLLKPGLQSVCLLAAINNLL